MIRDESYLLRRQVMKGKTKLIMCALGAFTLVIGFLVSTGNSQTNLQRKMPVKEKPPVMKQMPSVKTAPRTSLRKGSTPWQKMNVKQKKSLQKFIGPKLYNRFNKPINDVKYKKFVSMRGKDFRLGKKGIHLIIDTNAIIDIGAETMDRSNTMSLIDLGKSPVLNSIIKKELHVGNSKTSFVSAVLISSFALDYKRSLQSKQEKYRLKETLFVGSYDNNSKRTSLWMLENGIWIKQYDIYVGADQSPGKAIRKIEIGKEKTYFKGYRRVDLGRQGATVFSKRIVGQGVLPKMQCNSSGCIEARPQGTLNMSKRMGVDKDIIDAIVCDEYGCYQRSVSQQSDSTQQGSSGGQEPVPPKRRGYRAYGNPDYFSTWAGCNRKCSEGDCAGCCNGQFNIEKNSIILTTIACYSLCPPCIPACMEASAIVLSKSGDTIKSCARNCSQRYDEEGPNPNQCNIIEF